MSTCTSCQQIKSTGPSQLWHASGAQQPCRSSNSLQAVHHIPMPYSTCALRTLWQQQKCPTAAEGQAFPLDCAHAGAWQTYPLPGNPENTQTHNGASMAEVHPTHSVQTKLKTEKVSRLGGCRPGRARHSLTRRAWTPSPGPAEPHARCRPLQVPLPSRARSRLTRARRACRTARARARAGAPLICGQAPDRLAAAGRAAAAAAAHVGEPRGRHTGGGGQAHLRAMRGGHTLRARSH